MMLKSVLCSPGGDSGALAMKDTCLLHSTESRDSEIQTDSLSNTWASHELSPHDLSLDPLENKGGPEQTDGTVDRGKLARGHKGTCEGTSPS